MFSIAYVLLPISDTPPAEAIRASLAPFQRGSRGRLPESMLTFRDEPDERREEHEAHFEFALTEGRHTDQRRCRQFSPRLPIGARRDDATGFAALERTGR